MPQLVRDILEQAISTHSDMEVVSEEDCGSSTPVSSCSPDVIIVGTTAIEESQKMPGLLLRWPKSQVLMITVAGRAAALYELVPHKTALGELSPSELVDVIRARVKRNRAHATYPIQ